MYSFAVRYMVVVHYVNIVNDVIVSVRKFAIKYGMHVKYNYILHFETECAPVDNIYMVGCLCCNKY